jgi:hypothetical protein
VASTVPKDTVGMVLGRLAVDYDTHGQVHSTTDPHGGMTLYTYYDDDTVYIGPDGARLLSARVTTTYAVRGWTNVVTLPDGKVKMPFENGARLLLSRRQTERL